MNDLDEKIWELVQEYGYEAVSESLARQCLATEQTDKLISNNINFRDAISIVNETIFDKKFDSTEIDNEVKFYNSIKEKNENFIKSEFYKKYVDKINSQEYERQLDKLTVSLNSASLQYNLRVNFEKICGNDILSNGPINWLISEKLPEIYEEIFGRELGFSRNAGGVLGGPGPRFIKAALKHITNKELSIEAIKKRHDRNKK